MRPVLKACHTPGPATPVKPDEHGTYVKLRLEKCDKSDTQIDIFRSAYDAPATITQRYPAPFGGPGICLLGAPATRTRRYPALRRAGDLNFTWVLECQRETRDVK